MANTFTIEPTIASRKSHEPRVKRAQFGNGYYQIVGDGLNADLEKWSLTWILDDTDKQTVEDFFTTEGGYNFFFWTSPENGASQKAYICPKWSVQPMGADVFTITAEFEEYPGQTT